MSAYVIIDITVNDETMYQEYITKARPILEKYGAKYLASDNSPIPVSGEWYPKRLVVVEFPSAEAVGECFKSEEYQAVAPLRRNSTVSRVVVAKG